MEQPLKVGAVMYDPKVSVIWQIIRDFFESQGCPIDVAFYSTYEMQVTALLDRTIDIAWNSPLAWLDAQRRTGGTCRAIAMRDTDRERISYFVARRGGRCEAWPICEAGRWRPAPSIRRRPRSFRSGGCAATASTLAPTAPSGASTCSSASTAITWAASATRSRA
jgi:hypothetical protein